MSRVASAMLLLGSMASSALRSTPACAQHRDFLLVREGDSVVVGNFDWGASEALVPTYLRAGAFEYAEEDYAVATNPGFNAIEEPPEGYAPLPAGAEVDFSLLPVADLPTNLAYWSGTPPVAFEPASGESFLWAAREGGRALADGGDERVDGFVLASTSESGVFHEHIELVLLGAESMEPGAAEVPPRPGIYALAIAFRVEGLEESDPAYMLMQHGDLDERSLEMAEQWVSARWLDAEDRGMEGPVAPLEPGGQEPVRDCALVGDGSLGPGLIDHSCYHAEHGPFARVAAVLTASETANVDTVHTHYTIALRPPETGVVTYEPKRSGRWAVLSDLESFPTLADESGEPLSVLLEHAVPDCDGLPWARVYDLTAGERYQLRYEALDEAVDEAVVVIEKLSDFDTRYGADADGDGFGDPERVLLTPCAPPDDYVANVDDCDDDDPSVHPDVPGACEPIDDCDGPARDAGAACDPVSDAGPAPIAAMEDTDSGGGCSTARGPAREAPTWMLVLGLWVLLRVRRRTTAVTVAALLLIASVPAARAQHVDILLAQRQGRIETGAYDFGKAAARMPLSVYARAFETLNDEQVSGNDPGMAAVNDPPEPWSALPSSAPVTIGPGYRPADGGDRVAPLAYWDGEGEVHFAPAPAPLALQVALGGLFGPQSALWVDGEGATGEPFVFTTTDDNGALHQHLDLTVSGEVGEQPPAGVYLLSLRFELEDLQPSPPAFVLLHHGVADTALERATQCAADYLAPDCDDGIDNDGDGEADLDDGGCTDPSDLSELADCDDGLDNDGDDRIDGEDADCTDPEGRSECGEDPCPPIPLAWTCVGALKAIADGGAGTAPSPDAGLDADNDAGVTPSRTDAGADAGEHSGTDAGVADVMSEDDPDGGEASEPSGQRESGSSGCSLATRAQGHAGQSVLLAMALCLVCWTIRRRRRR